MKKLLLFLIITIFLSLNNFAANVSGVAVNSETGEPFSGIDILLTYTDGGVASYTTTASDGSFTLTDIFDGIYELEFYSYPDPVIINGDYFLRTIYEEEITVNGEDITGIEFNIPPHHPDYVLTGNLYDAVTNEIITVQDFQVRMQLDYYVEFFYDNSTENGMYSIDNLPNFSYELIVFENEYYEGVTLDVTIDTLGNDTINMDFYLEPKMGVTVSGVLIDSVSNQPIMMSGRSIKLSSSNSIFTETNENGEFSFINVPPGTYSGIEVTTQDTSYVNCVGCEISSIEVSDEDISDLQLYQKPWVSIHEITANNLTFNPGETKTVKFYIENDDLSYGSIWGVNLIFPEGVTVQNASPFYNEENNEMIFDLLPDCGTESIIAWQGWHWTGIPQFSSTEGNLDILNETAMTEVSLEFADSSSMESVDIFYEIYYETHCFWTQPFSYGTVMMINENILGVDENKKIKNKINSFPNPATDNLTLLINLDKKRKGELSIYNISGQKVMSLPTRIFKKGTMEIVVNISTLENGIYFYRFVSEDLNINGKWVISR
ncbi:MAG: T9SS type A sorting domain-containing protein [Bacteroidetes bacterium]|jgi:hypothetical protein|nr:T9SS type A sorting domain-containing protein [Bacteroidota bacterium]